MWGLPGGSGVARSQPGLHDKERRHDHAYPKPSQEQYLQKGRPSAAVSVLDLNRVELHVIAL